MQFYERIRCPPNARRYRIFSICVRVPLWSGDIDHSGNFIAFVEMMFEVHVLGSWGCSLVFPMLSSGPVFGSRMIGVDLGGRRELRDFWSS